MTRYTKYIGKVVINDPSDVQDKCTELGIDYHKGTVFCTIPEIGFLNSDLVPCRSGLSNPYLRPKIGWELLIEPTIIEDSGLKKRWFYTGIADCGGNDSSIEPTEDDVGIIDLDEGVYLIQIGDLYVKIDTTSGEITHLVNASGKITIKTSGVELGAGSEAMLLGDTLETWITSTLKTIFDAHVHTGVTTGGGSSGAPATPLTAPSGIKSTKHKVD